MFGIDLSLESCLEALVNHSGDRVSVKVPQDGLPVKLEFYRLKITLGRFILDRDAFAHDDESVELMIQLLHPLTVGLRNEFDILRDPKVQRTERFRVPAMQNRMIISALIELTTVKWRSILRKVL